MIVDPVDGLPVMEVGGWAREKHDALARYVDASRAARRKFGYSSYIDLFSGPGRVIERDTGVIHDGGALLAWRTSIQRNAAFSAMYIGDLNSGYVEACATRLRSLGATVQGFTGPASRTIDEVLSILPNGLHLAFVDPFNIEHLDFSIIRKLATQNNMDILLHFSVMDVQRNIGKEFNASDSRLEAAAPGWRDSVALDKLPVRNRVAAFLDYWEQLVVDLTKMRIADAKPIFINRKRGPLYRLIHLSRHDLAERLWNDVGRPERGQGRLFSDAD
ncbi:three-Cys-motif partner protein TcmP [Cupriavidus sp. CP313]